MHGRLKVKTTAQQEAERAQERRQKVARYKAAMATIFALRKQDGGSGVGAGSGPGDSSESSNTDGGSSGVDGGHGQELTLLKATTAVLLNNPDIATLWNIRRESILKLKQEATTSQRETIDRCESECDTPEVAKEENKPKEASFNPEKALLAELELTQQCLMSNPKSYGSWHHRCWTIDQLEKPDLHREAALTAKYLKMDSRNFHCWDYRRFVANRARFSNEHELDFAMLCIGDNFSNYSAWHVRSKLLPLCFPAATATTIGTGELFQSNWIVYCIAFLLIALILPVIRKYRLLIVLANAIN